MHSWQLGSRATGRELGQENGEHRYCKEKCRQGGVMHSTSRDGLSKGLNQLRNAECLRQGSSPQGWSFGEWCRTEPGTVHTWNIQ